jgi:hypothetical protein
LRSKRIRPDRDLSGAYGTAVFDLNADGYMDVVLSSKLTAAQDGSSYVYYGGSGSTGEYAFTLAAGLSTNSGRGVSLADLNGDKETDVVFAQNAASLSVLGFVVLSSSICYNGSDWSGCRARARRFQQNQRNMRLLDAGFGDGRVSNNGRPLLDEARRKKSLSGVVQPRINPFKY